MSPIRAFVALEIDEALRGRLAEAGARLAPLLPSARFIALENLHVTLRFLGASEPEGLARLGAGLAEKVAATPRACVETQGLGLFPPRGAPRVLWVGLALTEPLLALQAECERAAVAAGFAPEARPFRSHLTLARFRQPARLPELPALELGSTQLERITLFRSELGASGAVYTRLESWALGPAA